MAADKTFASLGRVEAIRQLFEGTPYRPFGEPCSFESKGEAGVFQASETLFEGPDFDISFYPLKNLGYKAVCAVTGELLASLAVPQTLSLVLGVSEKLDFEDIAKLFSGVVAGAQKFGYKSLGLDLKPSQNGLIINASATGTGATGSKKVKAQSKDLVCISGSLGAAFLGQQVLLKRFEQREQYRMLVSSYLVPELSTDIIGRFKDSGICPSFGYFVTRGLADAAMRLHRDSALGVKIYADKIPFEGNSFALGKDLNIDPISAAMNGGEDYRLLFTIPISRAEEFRKDFQTFDIIGHLALPEVGAVLVSPDGLEHPMRAQGWSDPE